MPYSTSNSEPPLWMITGTSSETSTDGGKGVKEFVGGLLGSEEETAEVSSEASTDGKIALPVGKLQQNLNQFLIVVGDLFIQAEQQAKKTQQISETPNKPGVQLDQIEFSVGINGEGEVGFWGLAQGKVGGMTEIKLTFKRQES